MFHLCKSTDDKFYVVLVATNHEVLSVTETFEEKQSAWHNMVVQLNSFNDAAIWVADRTKDDAVHYYFESTGRKEVVVNPNSRSLVNIWQADNEQFYVTVVGNNNQALSTTELLKQKQSAWVNIQAQMAVLGGFMVRVQDNTAEGNPQYWLDGHGKKVHHDAYPEKKPNISK